MADPRRMTPEEHGEAHALLVRAVTDPDWQAASQALDELMGKLVGIPPVGEVDRRGGLVTSHTEPRRHWLARPEGPGDGGRP